MDLKNCINILKKHILEEYDRGISYPDVETFPFNYVINDYNMDKIKYVDVVITILNYNVKVTFLTSEYYTDDCEYDHYKEFFNFNQDCDENLPNKREILENNLEIILDTIYKIRDEMSYSKIIDFFLPIDNISKIEELQIARDFFTKTKNIENCCVCDDMTTVKTHCNHFLCRECFNSMNKKCCPICRRDL
jgi:hypothetical protein